MQALFGTGFISEVSSWVVGFIVGAVFACAVLHVYIVAVAVIAGSLGYIVTVGVLTGIGIKYGIPGVDDRDRGGSCIGFCDPTLQRAEMGDHHRHCPWGVAVIDAGFYVTLTR